MTQPSHCRVMCGPKMTLQRHCRVIVRRTMTLPNHCRPKMALPSHCRVICVGQHDSTKSWWHRRDIVESLFGQTWLYQLMFGQRWLYQVIVELFRRKLTLQSIFTCSSSPKWLLTLLRPTWLCWAIVGQPMTLQWLYTWSTRQTWLSRVTFSPKHDSTLTLQWLYTDSTRSFPRPPPE